MGPGQVSDSKEVASNRDWGGDLLRPCLLLTVNDGDRLWVDLMQREPRIGF
jgi:hypothetical protein